MKRFRALALALIISGAGNVLAMNSIHWNGREIGGWICDGKKLRPKSGATRANIWVLLGNEIRPKAGANRANTWIRVGNEIRPKYGASLRNTWILQGGTLKPKYGANNANSWKVGNAPLLAIVGKVILGLF